MSFNYNREKKKHDAEWEEKEEMYRNEDMSEADIQIMREYDQDMFRKERIFFIHNDYLVDLERGQNSAYLKALQTEDQLLGGGMNWLDEVCDEKLYSTIKKMKKEDVELLTLWAIEGYSITEIANLKEVSQATISKKIIRIKKNLKKIRDNEEANN